MRALTTTAGLLGVLTLAGFGLYTVQQSRLTTRSAGQSPLPSAARVNALDAVVQERFANFDTRLNDFGISRIVRPTSYVGHGKWAPQNFAGNTPLQEGRGRENAEEAKKARTPDPAKELEREGWDVALAVVTKVPPKETGKPVSQAASPKAVKPQSHRLAKQALLLTQSPNLLPPDGLELEKLGGEWLQRRRVESAPRLLEGWSIVTRPILASKQECLRCHSQGMDGKELKLGEPLAAALYAFKSHRQAEPRVASGTR